VQIILNIFIFSSLHVSGIYIPIIKRTYCTYETLVFVTLYGWLFCLLASRQNSSSVRPLRRVTTQCSWFSE